MRNSRGVSRSAVTQAVKDRISIVDLVRRYVNLQRAGHRWMAPCPFHQETKASFSVNEEQGFFYCFGCQAAGDIFDFYSRINGVEFKEALEQLAEEAGISLKDSFSVDPAVKQRQDQRKTALKLHEIAGRHYRANLLAPAGSDCRKYINGRELDRHTVESFELGWSLNEWSGLTNAIQQAGFKLEQGVDSGLLIRNERGSTYDRFRGRLMFPIKNLSGQIIAFGGRIIDNSDTAKYINSSDSPIYKKGDNLYGLFQARRDISVKKSILLTEGYMDVLTLHQFGYRNACGVLGTALTPEQIKRLGGFSSSLELLFDGDGPGRKAALRACEMILTAGLLCRVVLLPEGEDIDSLLKNQGSQVFEDLRQKSPDGLSFCMRTLNNDFAPREISLWVKSFLEKIEQPELFSKYVSEFSKGLGLEENTIRKEYEDKVAVATGQNVKHSYDIRTDSQKSGIDRQFIIFAVRYPQHIEVLQENGIEFALSKPWACAFWSKIIACAPAFNEQDILQSLSEEEKKFWIHYRAVEVIPPDKEKEKLELEQICASIQRVIQEKQNISRRQALSSLRGDDYENEILRALHEKLTGKPLVEK